ncbi:MAG: hypothetical protein ACJ760_01100, partial [Thermoleophilaceae bacterium]
RRAKRRAAAKRAAGAGSPGAVPVPDTAGAAAAAPRLAPAASLRRASERVGARDGDEVSPAVIMLLIGTGLLLLAAAAAWRGRGEPLG